MIIDGYNVIHKVPEFQAQMRKSLEAGRDALIRYCGQWREKRKDFAGVHVVFDGDSLVEGPDNRMIRGVQVTFTRTKEDADDRIRKLVEYIPLNQECFVVSDDSELAAGVRVRRGKVMSVSEFRGALGKPGRSSRNDEADVGKPSLSPETERRINDELKRAWGITSSQ